MPTESDIIVRVSQPHGNRKMEFADLNIGDVIAGRYGYVFNGSWKHWNGEVAIKQVPYRIGREQKEVYI